MKHCQKHWDMTRKAIEDSGMGHLGAKSGEEAIENMKTEMEGETPPFDPLMSAWSLVSGTALRLGGPYLMNGDYCPVCELMKHTAGWGSEQSNEPVGEEWVENHYTVKVVEYIAEMAREKGLIPPKQ